MKDKQKNYITELNIYDTDKMDEKEIDAILAAEEEITEEQIDKEWQKIMKEFEGK